MITMHNGYSKNFRKYHGQLNLPFYAAYPSATCRCMKNRLSTFAIGLTTFNGITAECT